MKLHYCYILITFLASCNDSTIQVGENTFVHKNKVYKLIDNDIIKLADLESKDSIKPQVKEFGDASLSFVKNGATAQLTGLYRANNLYYKLKLSGINDLREKYQNGSFEIEFQDEYGFVINNAIIMSNQMVGQVGSDGVIRYYEYNGKTELSPIIFQAIKNYSVSSTVKMKEASRYGYSY